MNQMARRILLFCIWFSLTACGIKSAVPENNPGTAQPTSLPAILTGPDTAGVFRPSACPFVLPEGIVEGKDVECGFLPVYEQPNGSDSANQRIIRLAIAVFHPPGGATQPDPVLYLSGGPGASILKLIHSQYEILSKPVFDTGRSLIVFDQRGVGVSQPELDCPTYRTLSMELLDRQIDGKSISEQEIRSLILGSIKSCRDDLAQSADLGAYNSQNSAADVHQIVTSLGFQRVNLWGGSYGTRLALEVMRLYPDDLRSVILDAVYPPDADLYLEGPANFQRSLTRLFASCGENPVCSENYPELETVFFNTVARLDEQPVYLDIWDPYTGDEHKTLVNGNTLMVLTFQLLYDSRVRYFIPQIIYDVSQDDFHYLEISYSSLLALSGLSNRGMMFSVQCHEEVPFSSFNQFQVEIERYPQLAGMYQGAILGDLIYEACEVWSVGKAGEQANQPVSSAIPALILSGEFDPITPPDWGNKVAESLVNSFAFEFPGIGHGAGVSHPCPLNMMSTFLRDPGTQPDDSCLLDMQ